MLTGIALLHNPNILRCRTEPGKILHPTPLPPNFPQQTISSCYEDSYRVDDMSHYRICDSRRLTMPPCRLGLGYCSAWKVYQFSGFRILGCGMQHFRGLCRYAAPHLGAERFESRLEKETCSGLHVLSWILVSKLTQLANAMMVC
jgi:hypothetical protein